MERGDRTRSARRWSAIGPDHQLPPGDEPAADGGRTRGRRGDGAEPGLGDLLRALADDLGTLVRQEIELAKVEVIGTAKRMAADGVWIGVGVAIAALGGLVLVLAMALLLGALLGSYWLGTLITGLALLLLGGGLLFKGVSGLRKRELKPTRTVETLREDARWAGEEAREFKEAIKER